MKLSEKDIQKIDADIAKIACRRKTSPIIGIVPTQLPEEHILRVNDHYINAIVLAGGVPLILPLTADMRVYERLFGVVDGFVLTGGQDVDPKRYSNVADLDEQERSSYEQIGKITPMRDTIENLILRFACNNNVPLLGTCRGMQTMNVFFGGTLYLDLPSQFDGVDSMSGMSISHWQKEDPHQTTHYISVKKGSKLHGCLGADTAAANSFHHQGVKTLGQGLEPVAWATDGLVEAIESTEHTFMLGVQWHPEFFFEEKHMGSLFVLLVDEAAAASAASASAASTSAVPVAS